VGPGIEVEPGEVGAARGAVGAPGEVGIDAVEVDRDGSEHAGQDCLGMASLAAGADPGCADGWEIVPSTPARLA
jgi:hypothetical protein